MHPVLFKFGALVIPSYGVLAALGILLALALAQATSRRCGISPRHAWNMLVLAVFSGLVLSRLVLILANLADLRRHPSWMLALAMVHHPLLSGVGIVGGLIAVLAYALWAKLPLKAVADCLTAPVSIGIAAEQLGALLAGSDFGRESTTAWSVTYTDALAARWSGTPLGVPLSPVQAYASLGAILLTVIVLLLLRLPHRSGDVAGAWCIGVGSLTFITEMFRDWEGRGVLPNGALDIPQLVGLGLVILGGLTLLDFRLHAKATAAVALQEHPKVDNV